MKLYNPWTVAMKSDSPVLGMILAIGTVILFLVGMNYFPVVFIGGLFAAVIGRILYAILKGK